MPYPKQFEDHQLIQAAVRALCEANLELPDLEPERRVRVEQIRQAVSERMCHTKPEDNATCGDNIFAAREEIAWLKDPRVKVWVGY